MQILLYGPSCGAHAGPLLLMRQPALALVVAVRGQWLAKSRVIQPASKFLNANRCFCLWMIKIHTVMADTQYRLIDVDALEAEADNPKIHNVLSHADIQTSASRCRQLLAKGDQEEALREVLHNVPYGGDEHSKVFPRNYTKRAEALFYLHTGIALTECTLGIILDKTG